MNTIIHISVKHRQSFEVPYGYWWARSAYNNVWLSPLPDIYMSSNYVSKQWNIPNKIKEKKRKEKKNKIRINRYITLQFNLLNLNSSNLLNFFPLKVYCCCRCHRRCSFFFYVLTRAHVLRFTFFYLFFDVIIVVVVYFYTQHTLHRNKGNNPIE